MKYRGALSATKSVKFRAVGLGVGIFLIIVIIASAAHLMGTVISQPLTTATPYTEQFHVQEQDYRVEVVAEGLDTPWSMAFSPDGRIFLTERPGRVRIIQNGRLINEPIELRNVSEVVEAGLLGIAIHPDFLDNRYIYIYHSYGAARGLRNQVSRFTEADNQLSNETVILNNIPGSPIHDGGRIKFGNDGKLYISTGDAGQRDRAQDLDYLGGKILRVNPDGTIPRDNPFSGSPVYSLGHRNPQGMDWHPITGKLVITEHGPSGELGFAHDEVNLVEAGANYGWPLVVGSSDDPEYVNPIIHSGTETWAPSGAVFYRSGKIEQFKDKYIIATLRGQHLRVLGFNEHLENVVSNEVFFREEYGRIRLVLEGPDGYIYFATSNKDGRGTPITDDDRVLRIVPSEIPPIKQPTPSVPNMNASALTIAFDRNIRVQPKSTWVVTMKEK